MPGHKRIQLIKDTVYNLSKLKQDGLELDRDYFVNELVYDGTKKKFGRIIEATAHYFSVRLNDQEEITYFRKTGWKPAKESYLRDHYLSMTNRDLAIILNCTEKVVEKKLQKLGLKRNFEWDETKDDFLIRNFKQPKPWLADELQTTIASIKGRIYRLKAKGFIPTTMQRCSYDWKEDDDAFLLANLERSNQWLAKHFQVKVSTIKSRLRKLRDTNQFTPPRKRGKKKLDA